MTHCGGKKYRRQVLVQQHVNIDKHFHVYNVVKPPNEIAQNIDEHAAQ